MAADDPRQEQAQTWSPQTPKTLRGNANYPADRSVTLTPATKAPLLLTVAVEQSAALPQNEIQRITVQAVGGTFTVTFGGQTTTAIAYNATAATIKTALEALSSIGTGNVNVTQGPLPGYVDVEFKGTLAATNVALMTLGTGSLTTPTTTTVTTRNSGVPQANEKQSVTLRDTSANGLFALRIYADYPPLQGALTAAMPHNVTATAMQTELEKILGVGNVIVISNGTGSWMVEYPGTNASIDVPIIVAN